MKSTAKKAKRFPVKTLLFAILMFGIYSFWKSAPPRALFAAPPAASSAVPRIVLETRSSLPQFTIPVHVEDIADTRRLELINRDHGIVGDPAQGLIVPAWPTVPVSAKTVRLHEQLLEAVCELFAAAREAKAGSGFYVSSGYRDFDAQKQIYDETSDKSFVQPPGYSEHQSGLAADILVLDIGQAGMAASREGRWLSQNAWKYGLILRYPQDKQDITNISFEPWHFRYIGQPHAWYCRENNLCLEEYIQLLKDSGGYQVTLDGANYSVLYQIPQDGILYVPEDLDYSISGDNTGGFIVTAWG